MKKITLRLKENAYDIIIASGLLKKSGSFIRKLKIGRHAYIITNYKIKKNYGKILKDSLNKEDITSNFRLVKDNEKAKSIYLSIKIIKDILRLNKTTDTFIVAFGGGVIGDLSGFIASIYKRGIPYVQIPTTLLGQIDSGIGGKTAVDLKEAKNMIGTFYQPSLVLNDISLLKSLDKRQLRSGIAEAIKYGIIKDGFILNYIEKNLNKIFAYNEEVLENLIYHCAKIKAKIVEFDEKEKKMLRTILNFGHTIGHALEAASGYKTYTHGEAIGIGMLVALEIGTKLKLTSQGLLKRVEDLLKKVGLPVKINRRLELERIIQAHYFDKKFKGKENRFVLIQKIGRPIIKEKVPLPLIKEAIKKYY
jgi:3-dehydroquinate synthase